jgi:Topoisomerase II-associated protein PAT1
MSFFGFEQIDRLQQAKQRFLEEKIEQEDLAVYTWGEDSYDGLGNALQEGGDELNDETFGGTDDVGKFLSLLDHPALASLALAYNEQAGTLISHNRFFRLMTNLCPRPLSPVSSSHHLHNQIYSRTRHMPTKLKPHLCVRSSQN